VDFYRKFTVFLKGLQGQTAPTASRLEAAEKEAKKDTRHSPRRILYLVLFISVIPP
jgi:hypothetical protein